MKKQLCLLAAVILMAMPMFADKQQLPREVRNLPAFEAIEAERAVDVRLHIGEPHEVVVEGLHPERILTSVQDNRLIISKEDDKERGLRERSENERLVVHVTAPTVQSIDLSGASDLRCDDPIPAQALSLTLAGASDIKLKQVAAEQLTLEAKGASDVEIEGVSGSLLSIDVTGASDVEIEQVAVNQVVAEASGASDMTIEGTAKSVTLDVSGASDIEAHRLVAQEVAVEASGASEATVHATDQLTATASGASSVRYKGEPKQFSEHSRGFSTIRRK